MEKVTIFTDGASRGNPGPSSYGFAIYSSRGDILHQEGRYIGIATNNIAEYTAVIKALNYLKGSLNSTEVEIEIRADSNLVVQQLSGRFKIKTAHIKELIEKVKIMEPSFKKVVYTHVPRSENKAADKLANLALDSR